MSLSVYLRWDGMDTDSLEEIRQSIIINLTGTSFDRGWNIGYTGYLHDFNGPSTVAGTLVRDWYLEPARETIMDVSQLIRNLPKALHRLYESDDYNDREYRTAMLTGFVTKAIELHSAGLPLRILVW